MPLSWPGRQTADCGQYACDGQKIMSVFDEATGKSIAVTFLTHSGPTESKTFAHSLNGNGKTRCLKYLGINLVILQKKLKANS